MGTNEILDTLGTVKKLLQFLDKRRFMPGISSNFAWQNDLEIPLSGFLMMVLFVDGKLVDDIMESKV